MESATLDEYNDTGHVGYLPVQDPEGGGGIVDRSTSRTGTTAKEDDGADFRPPEPPTAPPLSHSSRIRTLLLGLLSAAPTLFLIGFGANASVASICFYVVLLQSTVIFTQHDIESGVARWFLGFVFVGMMSAWKSGRLLASCDVLPVKAVLYAVTALWECSNAVLVIGGKDLLERYGINGPRDIFLYSSAPCQVKFIQNAAGSYHLGDASRDCSPGGRSGKRSIHIALCSLGVAGFYYLLVKVQSVRAFFTSFVLLELECLALMASMSVVVLDVPSHLWQLIHHFLASTSLFASPPMHASMPKVILPYGWIYSSRSTRQFWSRWSRPATQLVRRLFYYPLGGRDRWYISIPIMFLLNAASHFDLSYALVGNKCEVYWIALFGTLAVAAMLEVLGDKFFAGVNNDGNTSFPSWYSLARIFLAHASLRLVLYIFIHLCLKTSLSKVLGSGDNDDE